MTFAEDACAIRIGDRVVKDGGDYTFEGTVVSIFHKKSGVVRYVVEGDTGILLIHGPKTIKRKQ